MQINRTDSPITLSVGGREYHWEPDQSLLEMMESEGIVKQVFPLHGIPPHNLLYFKKASNCNPELVTSKWEYNITFADSRMFS